MKRGVKVVLLLVLGGTVVLSLAPGLAERRINRVSGRSIEVSDHARKIHASLFVADLHADTTLWNRNVLVRGSRGHVDVPRLIEGGLALQAFTIVTKTPRNLNIVQKDTDNKEMYGMKYTELIPVLVKAIQEQQVQIENLKSELNALKINEVSADKNNSDK